ncbi:MAG: hypothetical protein EXQ96_10810, partial [Alphaproteobacteria bacterium]|nr:hypothetical protein [Alphaproteobacteria bacterium]
GIVGAAVAWECARLVDALVGHTGFVGGNLLQQHAFGALYNSRTIDQIRGTQVATLVFAGAAALARGDLLGIAGAVACSPLVFTGLALYGFAAGFWLFVLARIDVSVAYPFVGIGFLLTMAFGALFLGESINATRLVGTLLVAGGVYLVAQS